MRRLTQYDKVVHLDADTLIINVSAAHSMLLQPDC